MTASPSRRLMNGTYLTARSTIPLPFPLDVDLAPQLIAVTLTQAALAATHRAFDSVHPIIALTAVPGKCPQLTHSEHLAVLILDAANQLALLLADYAAAVIQHNFESDDDNLF